MTQTRKYLIERMLQGYYMKPWLSTTGAKCYRLYDPAGQAVETIEGKTVDTLERFIDPKRPVFKTKKGIITLSLANIRILNGNNDIKKLYKKHLLKIKKDGLHRNKNNTSGSGKAAS